MPKTYTITIGLATEQTARIQIEADSPMAAAHLAIANIPAPGPAWTKHPTAPSDPYILMIDDDFDHIPIEYDRTVATMGTPETKEHRIDTARRLLTLASRVLYGTEGDKLSHVILSILPLLPDLPASGRRVQKEPDQ